jgi:hypothetical protein
MAGGAAAWQRPLAMKALLLTLVLCAALLAALVVPLQGRSFWQRAQEHGIPAAVARGTAHGLRATWDYLSSLSHRTDSPGTQPTREPPAHSPRHASRKSQAAAAPAHRASREGIVAQPPKEQLPQSDRAALDNLVAHAR